MHSKLNTTKKGSSGYELATIIKATQIFTIILLTLTILSALTLLKTPSQSAANAESSSITASVTVENSCTMSGSIETNKAHTATVQSGSYTADIGETLVSVSCNDSNGYSVYAIGFTGDVDGTTTLVGANTNLTIPTGTSTSTASSNWAMKLSAVSGTSAPTILSDTNGSFASYHVVPSTATKVATLTSNTESSSSFKTTYAVAIGTSQPADTYSGQVKYTLVHPNNAGADGTVPPGECTSSATCMQTFTNSMCEAQASDAPVTLTDARDGNTYTVRYLQGACWMTQNLRLTNTVSSQYSNFSTNSTFNPCVGDLTAGDSYVEARCHDSGSTETGVWYNYASASAGTITGSSITGSSNSTIATEDICPAGWHLPSYDTTKPAGSVNSLLDLPITSYFSPVTGGNYRGGDLVDTVSGCWWSSVIGNITDRYYLAYNGSNLLTSHSYRRLGFYIRCVRQ